MFSCYENVSGWDLASSHLELNNCSHVFVFSFTLGVPYIPVQVKHGAIKFGLFTYIEFLSFHYENGLSRSNKLCLTRWRNLMLTCLLLLAAGIRSVVSMAVPIACLMVVMVHGVRILDCENSDVSHYQDRLTCGWVPVQKSELWYDLNELNFCWISLVNILL